MATEHDDIPRPDGSVTFAELLRTLRVRALLTQEQLAARSDLSPSTIRALESSRIRRPRGESLRRLADALGLGGAARAALTAAALGEPAAPVAARPAPPGDIPPCQLPMDVADFTGRAESLRQLDALLAGAEEGGASAVVVSAIAGTAGVGKTALAIHWAHRVRGRFPDGHLYLNLQGFGPSPPLRPIQALASLLRGLAVAADRVPLAVEEAAGLYRSLLAGRRMLVILDNARSAAQVRPLLPGSAGCLVVVTSRDRLTGLVAMQSARRLTLDVLSRQEAVSLLARVVGEERVAAEPAAAAELARLCACLPLAVRIAAANLTCRPAQPVAAYVAELSASSRLAALEVPGDPEAAVRLALDASYAALEADARRVFRLLGLVPGAELSVQAAAALTGVTVARAGWLLERLLDAHLLEPRGTGRFGLHDLLRLYAAERAQREESAARRRAAVGRLLAWYLRAADRAAMLLYPQTLRLPVPTPEAALPATGIDGHAGALEWLDLERPNLVAAVQHAAEHGPRPVAWLLADALRGYFFRRRHTMDWLTIARAALAAAAAERDQRAQAAARLSLGAADVALGRYPQAIEHYQQALTLARQAGWADGEAASLGNLGNVHGEIGRLRQAAAYLTQALALLQGTHQVVGQATVLSNLANVYHRWGRLRQACEHQSQALELSRRLGSPSGEAISLVNLGEIEHALGRLDQALEHLSHGLSRHREVGNRYGEVDAGVAVAALHLDAGRPRAALDRAGDALSLAREIGDRRNQVEALNLLGSVLLRLGHPPEALDHHGQALGLAREVGIRAGEAAALLGMAAVHQQGDQAAQAIEHAERALALAADNGYGVLEGQARGVLAAAHLASGEHRRAVRLARQAAAVSLRTGHRLGQARALLTLGRALCRTEGAAAARPSWQQALELLRDVGSPEAAEAAGLLAAPPDGGG